MSSQENPPEYGVAQPPPPQYAKGGGYGYQPVPTQEGEGQTFATGGPAQHQGGYGSINTQGYAPAPGSFQPGQQTTSNVVVMRQPVAPTVGAVQVVPATKDYMTLTIVLMVLCFLHANFPAFVCLIPALMFASKAADNNAIGNYDEARHYGRWALRCNVAMLFSYMATLFAGVVIGIVLYFALVKNSHYG